ncbi:MAG: methyltransferase domain-containing protein [Alphaproteobacteria bacterium]
MSDQERWQLSATGAANYEKYQVPSVFEPMGRMFLERFPLTPGERVLDVACGTGIVARLAAPKLGSEGRVVGIDMSAAMIAVAGEQPAPEGAPIEWREGDAAALPFDDASFDAVLCQQGLQFMPDKPAVIAEMHRVLAAGGRLGLCLWRSAEHSPYLSAATEALTPHVGAQSAERLLAPVSFGDETEIRSLIEGAGFSGVGFQEIVVVRRMLPPNEAIPAQINATPVGPDFSALDERTRAQIVAQVAQAMAPYLVAEGMEIPQGAVVVTATK